MNFFSKLSTRNKIELSVFAIVVVFSIFIGLQFNRLAYSENQVISLQYIEKATKTLHNLSVVTKNDRLLLLEMIESDEPQVVERIFENHIFKINHTQEIYDSIFFYVEKIYKDQNNLELVRIANSIQGSYSETHGILKSYFNNAHTIKVQQLKEGDQLLKMDTTHILLDSTYARAIVPIKESDFEGNTRSAQLSNLYRFYSKKSAEIEAHFEEILNSLHEEYVARDKAVVSLNDEMIVNTGIFLPVMIVSLVLILLLLRIMLLLPLKKMKSIMSQLANGEIVDDAKFMFLTEDEIGNMSRLLGTLNEALKDKSTFATEIGKGNFSSDFKPIGSNDVLGNILLNMRDSLKVTSKEETKRKLEDKERAWTTEGLALFGDILRKHTENITLLSGDIITNLVRYLDVNQGGIFILNDSNPNDVYLELTAAYAYGREKFLEKKIRLGEGLVGGVAIEKYTVYMTDLPNNYIDIESGLGSSNPKSLLIVPLKLDEDVLGVIELASFKSMKPHEIKLVERIAENIASTLSTTRINTTTAELLEQSKVREQEMQEREDEMQREMSEIKASQRELIKKDRDLSNEVKELEAIRLELIEQKNKRTKRLENLTVENTKCRKDLNKLYSQISQIFEVDIIPIIVIDEYVEIKVFNKEAENITGYNRTELIGRGIGTLFTKDIEDEISNHVRLFFETRQSSLLDREFSVSMINKEEKAVPVQFKMRELSIRDQGHLVLFMKNLVAIKELEEQRDNIKETLMSKEFDYSIRVSSLEHFINQNGLIIPLDLESTADLMRWNVTYSIGLNVIDNQHRRWVEFINVLYKAYKLNSKKETVLEHIDKLLDYSDYHFGFEEKYMEDFKCNVLDEHKKSHKHFVDSIRELRMQYKQGDKRALYKLIILLHNLTASHIEESREYVPCFKKNGFS